MSVISFQSVRAIASRMFILISVLALASCGGGGGGGGSNTGTTASTDATLSALSLSHGTLSPAFLASTTSYSATVSYTVTSVAVNATTTDSNATYKVSGGSSLKVGTNTIDVVVTAQDGTTTNTYQISVTRAANTDATLSALSLSHGTLSPAFLASSTSYSATVSYAVTSVAVNATTTDSNATYKVNGGSSLKVGTNNIDVIVTAQDGATTNTYQITVTRAANTDATLSALSISSGSLSPSFASGTTSYSDSVNYAVTSVTVNATTTDANATYTVSGGSSLNVGTNTIDVVVTAQDGTTKKTYSITVTRQAASTDATLSALSISSGSLSPAFSSSTITYSDSVDYTVSSVTVRPTTTDSHATIKVNTNTVTSGTDSAPISLSEGKNTISVAVTAQDGTTKNTYTITVKQLPALSALSLTHASLDQSFQGTQLSYTASVNYLVNAIGVTATLQNSGDSLTIDGKSATSATEMSPVYLATGTHNVDTVVTATDGTTNTYSVAMTRNPSLAQHEYNASDAVSNDNFGVSVAISGNTMVIGADQRSTSSISNSGAAYVFVRSSSTGSWTPQAVLTANNAAASDDFGKSVAIDGNTIVVGAPFQNGAGFNEGAAYVFTRSGTNWNQTGYLKASDAASLDFFGNAVAISGNTIVVGAYNKSNVLSGAGAAYVYVYDSGTSQWTQQQEITASDASSNDQFGNSVAIDKDTLVVGAPQHNSSSFTNDGAAYVFTRSSSTWSEQTILQANNAAAGDNFGKTVSIDSGSIAIGATGRSSNAGAAYVFTGSGASWTQQAYLTASNAETNDYFGHSIAISGERLVVGADQEDGDASSTMSTPNNGASNSGAVYVFMRNGSSWAQTDYLKANNAANSDYFGSSVGIDNDTLVSGARGATATTTNTATSAGGVYTFQ